MKLNKKTKHISRRIAIALACLALISCGSPEPDIDNGQAGDGAEPQIQEYGYACQLDVNADSLELYSGASQTAYMFAGSDAKNAYASYGALKACFYDSKAAGNLVAEDPSRLEIHFGLQALQSVDWHDYYYYPYSDSCRFSDLARDNAILAPEPDCVLPIGMNLAIVLDSDLAPERSYRLVRIACKFEDRTLEYFICLSGLEPCEPAPEASDCSGFLAGLH